MLRHLVLPSQRAHWYVTSGGGSPLASTTACSVDPTKASPWIVTEPSAGPVSAAADDVPMKTLSVATMAPSHLLLCMQRPLFGVTSTQKGLRRQPLVCVSERWILRTI